VTDDTYKKCLVHFQQAADLLANSADFLPTEPFDAHCCHMGTAIKHHVPDRVKPAFVIFDIWAL